MKIAIIGSRGIPPNYGGFETAAYYIATYLADKGEEVLVYCLSGLKDMEFNYRNIKRIFIPVIHKSSVEKLMLANISTFHAILKEQVDVIILLGVQGNTSLPLVNLVKKKVIITFDGLEWKREKWNALGKGAFKFLEYIGAKLGTEFVADSKGIQEYLKDEYNIESNFIPYGTGNCDCNEQDWKRVMEIANIEKNRYFIVVGRNVPENNFEIIYKSFQSSNIDAKLVVVSDIQRHVEDNIIFTGPIYDKTLLSSLRKNSLAYIHGHSVGGTNPSLLESISCNNRVIAYDVIFNREVLENYGLYFSDSEQLTAHINSVIKNTKKMPNSDEIKKYYKKITDKYYNWDSVGEKYYNLIKL